MNEFKKHAKTRLNAQRKQIVSTGRKGAGYKAQHRKGCGTFLLVGGLTLMSISAVAVVISQALS